MPRTRPVDWFGEWRRPKDRDWPAEALHRLPGRDEAGIYGRIVLDCRDSAGRLVSLYVLSGIIRRRAQAAAALFKARNLYPAARLVVVEG
jgi:hypothetical protein